MHAGLPGRFNFSIKARQYAKRVSRGTPRKVRLQTPSDSMSSTIGANAITDEQRMNAQLRPRATPPARTAIRYAIRPLDPRAHTFEVRCTVTDPAPDGQRFAEWPWAWIPGSYLIRDFARHIVTIRAESSGKPIRLEKIDKHSWQAPALRAGATISVVCEIYAWDPRYAAPTLIRRMVFSTAPASSCASSATTMRRRYPAAGRQRRWP